MTTTWLLIWPIPLELILPLIPLSQPIPTSMLHGDSVPADCASAVDAGASSSRDSAPAVAALQVFDVIRSSPLPIQAVKGATVGPPRRGRGDGIKSLGNRVIWRRGGVPTDPAPPVALTISRERLTASCMAAS